MNFHFDPRKIFWASLQERSSVLMPGQPRLSTTPPYPILQNMVFSSLHAQNSADQPRVTAALAATISSGIRSI